jgi:hypothetical protein
MTITVAPLASAAGQNSAYAHEKEGRCGKPWRPSLFVSFTEFLTELTELTE